MLRLCVRAHVFIHVCVFIHACVYMCVCVYAGWWSFLLCTSLRNPGTAACGGCEVQSI